MSKPIKLKNKIVEVKSIYYYEGDPYTEPGVMVFLHLEGQPILQQAHLHMLDLELKDQNGWLPKYVNGKLIVKPLPKEWIEEYKNE